jgi:hypothetical protein
MARASPSAAFIMPEIAYAFGMSKTNVSRAYRDLKTASNCRACGWLADLTLLFPATRKTARKLFIAFPV